MRLTPEEYVRQNFLHRLVEEFHYPAALIAVEQTLEPITSDTAHRLRADAVVYNRQLQPRMLLEFKADTVALSQRTMDQIAVYNRLMHVPYLVLHNGHQTVVAQVEEKVITFMDQLPAWTTLSN